MVARAALAALILGCTTGSPPSDGGPPLMIDGNGARAECTAPGSTVGQECIRAADCSDHCFCNGAELCVEGHCAMGSDACDDRIECTHDACDEESDRCTIEPDDTLCNDGNPCNGLEVCARGCVAGPRMRCDDDNACTFDGCEAGKGCTHSTLDLDGDGHPSIACGGDDCDDVLASVTPLAGEVCGNSIDDDCDGLADALDDACAASPSVCASAATIVLSGTYPFHAQHHPPGRRLTYDCMGVSGGFGGESTVAVIRLTLSADADVSLDLSTVDPSLAPMLSVRGIVVREWSRCDLNGDARCVEADVIGSYTHTLRSLPAGEYAVLLLFALPFEFDASVDVNISAPSANNDVCDARTELLAPGSTARGSFADLGFEHISPCTTLLPGMPPRFRHHLHDAAYRFTLDARSLVRARGSIADPEGSMPAWLAITRDCEDVDSALSCARTTGTTPWRALDPGTYFVLVAGESEADYDVTLEVRPVGAASPGEDCASAAPAPATPNIVDGSALRFDALVECAPRYDRVDVVYRLDLVEESDVSVEVPGADISLSSGCGEASSYCGTSADVLRNLPAGAYYLAISLPEEERTVAVRVMASPRPAESDTCALARAVRDGDRLEVDLSSGFTDDYPVCGATGRADAAYRVHLDARSRLVVVASTTTMPFALSVSAGCDAEHAIRCGTTGVLSEDLAPGDYDVFADGSESVELAFFITPL